MQLRLRQIAIVVRDIEQVRSDLEAVFGLTVGYEEESMPGGPIGMQNRLLPVGTQFIELVSPVREGVTGARYLERRGGDGGYMVICQVTDREPRDGQIRDLNIRTVGGRDTEGVSFIQLHPKDTGGSFLEIDWHEGYDEPIPPWTHAAGTDWAKAIRTDVVDAIAGAEIQAADPAKVAARWSQITEIPVTNDSDGHPSLQLDGSSIRFVPDTDGRGEGLSGLDVHAVDGRKATQSARMRGLRTTGATIELAGMRFRLVGV